MLVCYKCLKAIESREGPQNTVEVEDFDENTTCDWCGDNCNEELYEIISDVEQRSDIK